MAAPNLNTPSTITGKSAGAVLGSSVADLLTNAAASGKVIKVNTAIVGNVDVSNRDLTLSFFDASAAVSYRLAFGITVPAKGSFIAIGKDAPLYLEEGDKITGLGSSASKLEVTFSYEEIS